jgi:general secretion pathway protein C
MNAASWLEGLHVREEWRSALLTRGPRIATWVLAAALAAQLAFIVTDLAGASRKPAAAQAPLPSATSPSGSRVDIASIVNAHLFGQADQPPAQLDASNAPQTSMPLVLAGIIASTDPKLGYAIVGESAASARVHSVGDALPGGARLHSVLADRVVLERNGQLETLMLPRQSAPAGMSVQPAVSAAPASAPPPAAASAPPPAERMRQLVTEQPGAMSELIRQQPVFADGKMRGFRVYPGRSRTAFSSLGLRPGDLVTAINGTPLDDPSRSQEVFRTLGSSSEARVTVVRNGRQQDLTLNLAQVAAQAEQAVGAQGATPVDQLPPVPGAAPGSSE